MKTDKGLALFPPMRGCRVKLEQRMERYREVEDKEEEHLLVKHCPVWPLTPICVQMCNCLLSEDPARSTVAAGLRAGQIRDQQRPMRLRWLSLHPLCSGLSLHTLSGNVPEAEAETLIGPGLVWTLNMSRHREESEYQCATVSPCLQHCEEIR